MDGGSGWAWVSAEEGKVSAGRSRGSRRTPSLGRGQEFEFEGEGKGLQ